MFNQLRMDRITTAAIHSTIHPVETEPVSRVSATLPLLSTNHHVSENDIYAYGFALKRNSQNNAKITTTKTTINPGEWFLSLSNHSQTLAVYDYFFSKIPTLSQQLIKTDSSVPFSFPETSEFGDVFLSVSLQEKQKAAMGFKGLTIDVYQ